MILTQFTRFLIAVFLISALSSCATLIGGSAYNAHVVVEDHPKAKVTYKDKQRSRGFCKFRVPRKKANKVAFTISEDSCETQTFYFKGKKFRHGIFSATVSANIVLAGGFALDLIILPIPIGIDFITGAVWRPDVREHGISKISTRNYLYTIDNYTGCDIKYTAQKENTILVEPFKSTPAVAVDTDKIQQNTTATPNNSQTAPQNKGQEKIARLKELKRLLDEGVLTEEEFTKEKQKVLNEE